MPATIQSIRNASRCRPFAIGAIVIALSLLVPLSRWMNDASWTRAGVEEGTGAAPHVATAADQTVHAHPEWVLPYAADIGDFSPPSRPTPSPLPTTTVSNRREVLPTWLAGQADLSPAAVFDTWRAYARTQGPSLEAMQELVAYARLHPSRTADPSGQSVDAWLHAVASDPQALQQMVAAGYLDDRMSAFSNTSNAMVTASAVRDLDWASGCAGKACGSWRLRYAEVLMRKLAERGDSDTNCDIARLAAIGGWVVHEESAAAKDVARAIDRYLARQHTITCEPTG